MVQVTDLEGRVPSYQQVKFLLDTAEFMQLPLVKYIMSRCPAEHRYKVIYAYAQVRRFIRFCANLEK